MRKTRPATAGSEDGGRGHTPRVGQPLEADKARNGFFS